MDLEPRRRRYSDIFDLFDDERPYICRRQYRLSPSVDFGLSTKDLGSKIKIDKDKFQVNVDVQHFLPEEIHVQTSDGYVIVEGKHEEKKDEHGYVSRQFKRRYALPEGCSPASVESKLSSDGILSIIAPRQVSTKDVRAVPITRTGPVRRKVVGDDHEDLENGDDHEAHEDKSPQKKKSRR